MTTKVKSTVIFTIAFFCSIEAIAEDEWSTAKTIEEVIVVQESGVLRVKVNLGFLNRNPSGCQLNGNGEFIDVILNEEQLPGAVTLTDDEIKLITDAIFLAAIGNRSIDFLVSDGGCSSVLSSFEQPIAVGVRLLP